jgi:hypothetical protein
LKTKFSNYDKRFKIDERFADSSSSDEGDDNENEEENKSVRETIETEEQGN